MSINVSRNGQVNGSGSTTALFKDIFTGEVLLNFMNNTIMRDKVNLRTIQNGTGARFDYVGNASAGYHTIGSVEDGQNINHATKTISVDALLKSSVWVHNVDEAMGLYDVRSKYTQQMGVALAQRYDRNLFAEGIKGARAGAVLTEGVGGSTIASDDFKIDASGAASRLEQAQALAEALFSCAQTLDEKNIPEGLPRFAVFRPAEYYALAQNTDLINKEFGGQGAIAEGNIVKVAGITLLKSNNLPKYNATKATYDPAGGTSYITNPEYDAYHNADFSKTVGFCFCPDAIAAVELMGLATDVEYSATAQATFIITKMLVGMGYFRNEMAIELKLNSLSNTAATYPS